MQFTYGSTEQFEKAIKSAEKFGRYTPWVFISAFVFLRWFITGETKASFTMESVYAIMLGASVTALFSLIIHNQTLLLRAEYRDFVDRFSSDD